MSEAALLYPMAAMVLLVLVTLGRLFFARTAAVSSGSLPVSFLQAYEGAREDAHSAQLARHFSNLFETPTLFFAGCLAAMALARVDLVLVLLVWAYVAARVAHAWVHTGRNALPARIRAFGASVLTLTALWAWLVLSTLFANFAGV